MTTKYRHRAFTIFVASFKCPKVKLLHSVAYYIQVHYYRASAGEAIHGAIFVHSNVMSSIRSTVYRLSHSVTVS